MHKPFDFEAANAGEPVEYRGLGDRWELCRFLGISESGDGYFVIERINGKGFQLSYATAADLRMAPKKVTVRYRIGVVRRESGDSEPVLACNEWSEGIIRNHPGFVDWLTDWQEVEVPQ